MANLDALTHQAGQRTRGYWLLSRLFLEVPTAAMLADLNRLLADAGDAASPPELAALREAVGAALTEPQAAAIAFTRHLTLGDKSAGEPLPFEAHVREGCLPGESTQEVAAAMREAGYLDVAPEASSPDHLGAELRFIALLCHDEHNAWSAGDRERAGKALRLQQEFLRHHLAEWVPEYCRGLRTRTNNSYLRAVALIAASTVEADAAILDEICRWINPETISASPTQH
jgi:TorA maturation chaperone TorD